jgi:hypothetical protein
MKLSRFTILVFCGLLPQVFIGQNVQVVVGNATVSSAPESAAAVKSLQGETQEGNKAG